MSKNESMVVVYLIIDETYFPFVFLLTDFISFVNLPVIVSCFFLFEWCHFLVDL